MLDLEELQLNLGVKFKNQDLLRQAMVHRSFLNENHDFDLESNERLEFLGDAVLEIVVTEYLYLNFPQTPEGDLTNWRASLVNAKMLFNIAQEVNIEGNLYLSHGESKEKNSKARQYILANALEAVIGAIYLDSGLAKAKGFIDRFIVVKLAGILENESYVDPKSRFQEIAQDKKSTTPHYQIISEDGPDHDKKFVVGLYIGEELVSTGEGYSKHEAQVAAAIAGLKKNNW